MAASSASSRPWAKRQRLNNERRGALQDLLHEGTVSNSGLLRILTKIKDMDLSVDMSKDALGAVYRANFERVRVTETFELVNGQSLDLELAEPALLISELVSSSRALADVYAAAIRQHGCRGWRAIVAFDEFTPGSKLRVDNRRKAMNCFVAFLELGQYALAESAAWAIPMIIRHDKLVQIRGGWARVLRCFLIRLLFGTHGLVTAGLALQIADQRG